MMHIKEVIEKMKEELKEETSYKIVLEGDVVEERMEFSGHAPTMVQRLSKALGVAIAKAVAPESLETAYETTADWVKKAAEEEMAKK
ncbi:MAG: hypothetical protein IJN27_01855 [Oscillospiraceae bacterium]|nr:hypothetical protein [Oscillospiraceae bacterium]